MEVSYPKNRLCTLELFVTSWKGRDYSSFCCTTRANGRSWGEISWRDPEIRSPHDHDHFAFAPTIEFTEKNSLPTTQQQRAVCERNGNA